MGNHGVMNIIKKGNPEPEAPATAGSGEGLMYATLDLQAERLFAV